MKSLVIPAILCLHDLLLATEKIEVLGTRVSQFSEQRAEHLEISQEDIESSGTSNLAEILELIPGLRVTPGLRGQTLTIQGLSGKFVKILINGSPIGGRINGSYDLSRIKLNNVKRIEIIKGPSSSLHGSHAMGGLINIITDWNEQSFITVNAKNSSIGKNNVSSSLHQSFDSSQLHLLADYADSSGYTVKSNSQTFKSPRISESGLHLQYGFDFSSTSTISFLSDFQSRVFSTTDYYATGAIFNRTNRITHTNAQIQSDTQYSNAGSIRAKAAINNYRDHYRNDQRGSNALDADEETNQSMQTYNVDLLHQLQSHEIAGGIEQSQETFVSDRLAENQPYDRHATGVYLQDRWQISDVLFTLGARQEIDSQFNDHLSKKFAINYKTHDTGRFVASYSEGFRPPDFKELYMSFINNSVGYEVSGNKDLKPEISQYYAIEYREQGSSISWNVRAFKNNIKNLISTHLTSQTIESTRILYQYENIYKYEVVGGAVELQYLDSQYFGLKVGHVYTESRDQQTGSYLADRPLNSTKLNLLLIATPSLRINLSLNHYGKRAYYEEEMMGWLVPYTMARIASNYEYNDSMKFQLGLNNLLNEGDPVYLPLEPLHVYFGISTNY